MVRTQGSLEKAEYDVAKIEAVAWEIRRLGCYRRSKPPAGPLTKSAIDRKTKQAARTLAKAGITLAHFIDQN